MDDYVALIAEAREAAKHTFRSDAKTLRACADALTRLVEERDAAKIDREYWKDRA